LLAQGADGDGEEISFEGEKPVYLEDNFNWASVATFGGVNGFPTTEVSIIHASLNDAQLDTIAYYGWTGPLRCSYLRPGMMKLGKTNVGGDLVSPPFTRIGEGTVDLTVYFDVSIYASAGGTKDMDGVIVEVLNDGTVNGRTDTEYRMAVNHFTNQAVEITTPLKRVSVKIYGATARTQFRIRSLVPDVEQRNQGRSNRFFFDNFKVEKR
ncbi:MAG: hypothetical protein LBH19_10700, partial [Dysgonamonadaceae bacterium]|nr:hypothetical protein [Dysgonamonadaceae bacterium]